MKGNVRLTLFVALSCFALKASAQLIAYESFSGAALGTGITGTGSDSFGWTEPWMGAGTSDSHYQIVDPTPDLVYQVIGGGLISGGARALLLTTKPEPLPTNLLTTRAFPAINTTFYLSFLLRMPESGTGSDSIDLHMMNGSDTHTRFTIRPENPGPPAGYIWKNGTGAGLALTGDNTKTHFIVVEAKLSGGGGGGHYVNVFVNPGTTYPGFPGGFSGGATTFDRIGLSISSTDTAGPTTAVLIDEFRLGYTWVDVVAQAPQPILIPNLEIVPAVKLRWQTQVGKSYQIQYSYDLSNWFNMGSVISGNNQIKEVFDSVSDAKKYYRIQSP